MLTETIAPTPLAEPYSEAEIKRRIDGCPKLASLQSINKALSDLIRSEQSLSSQIAEIIRRDPSLSARLLRMVNSVYYGLSARVNNIEEAVFFLGLRQIRELSIATPVLEDLAHLQRSTTAGLPWKELWTHSIGTAILTREILDSTQIHVDDDTDYLVGLLHNVGKVVMAYAFPDELAQILKTRVANPGAVCVLERTLIGWDHARIGAYYLTRHQLSEEITSAVLYHNEPDKAPHHRLFAAAIQIADYLARHRGISGGFEQVDPIVPDAWVQLPAWKILYGEGESANSLARASLANCLQRLPTVLQGLL